MFPVPFRALPRSRQFKKYSVIQLRVHRRNGSDRRPESRQPDLDSLRIGPVVPANHGWRDRWAALGDLVGTTTACRVLHDANDRAQEAPSLGLIKPARIKDVTVEDNPDYAPLGGASVPDVDLFGTETEVLESQPFIVKLRYECTEAGCRGHHQTVVDWEAGQLGRRMVSECASRDVARERVRARYSTMCAAGRDTHLFLGNQHQHPRSFLVLGLFWPPIGSRPPEALF